MAEAATTHRPPKLADVARRCQLSKAAVSQALNWRPGQPSTLKQETRERIVAAAQEMGYRPSFQGRALSTKRSQQVAVVYRPPIGPVPSGAYQRVTEAIDAEIHRRGYHSLYSRVSDDPQSWMDLLGGGRFDGVIALCDLPQAVEQWMASTGLPAVIINSRMSSRWSQVTFDDRMGARLLTEHLLGLGHRRISFFLSREPLRHHSAVDRVESYREVMREAQLPADEPFVGPVATFVEQILARPQRPTAVIAYEHVTAIRILQELWRRKYPVPAQISVGTFNDVYPTDAVTPSLTTVAMPAVEIARSSLEMLFSQIEQPNTYEPRQVNFGMTLVVRESTAPAPHEQT